MFQLPRFSKQTKEKVWNFEYVDLSQFLTQNFISNVDDQPCNLEVVNGKLVLQQRQKKIKAIDTLDLWTDAFTNYAQIIIQNHPYKASELLKYMSIIRNVAHEQPYSKWLLYDQQFRLRISRNPSRSWSTIDGDIWLRFILSGNSAAVKPDIQKSKLHCFDYNYKGRCIKPVCTYKHTCMKCQMKHPSIHCFNINGNQVNAQTCQNNGYGQPTQEVSQFNTRRGLLQRPNQSR